MSDPAIVWLVRAVCLPYARPMPSDPSPRSLHLAPLRADQVDQALTLDRLCFDNLWSADAYGREIDSDRSDLLLLSETIPGPTPIGPTPIGLGCLWAILNEGHITLLGIHPDYRGQGLGGWLLVQLLRSALARSLDSVTLEVRASNDSALRLYNRFGFQQVGRRRAYYQVTDASGQDHREDALILCRHRFQQADSVQQLGLELGSTTDRLHQNHWYP
jgi:[ribosomal protein S18]-alanine N-acetyltransferase